MADAGGVRAGGAFVEIFSKDAALDKGLRNAESKVKAFGATITGMGLKLGALGAAITAPLIAATAAFAEGGSALLHMSQRTGVSVEALSALGYAAKQSGADLDEVEVSIKRMQKALTAGSEENQAAAGTFASLGLSIRALARLKPEQQFQVIGKRISEIKDPTARAGAAMQVFGRSGTQILPLLENMGKLTQEAKDFGLVTSTEAAEGAHKLEQSLNLLNAVTKKIVTTVGSALAPSFEAWNLQIAKVAKYVKTLIEANKPLIVTISAVGFSLVAAGAAFVVLGSVISGIGATFGAIATVVGIVGAGLGLMLTPIGALIVGFAAMTTAMELGQAGAAAVGFLKGQFGGLLTTAQETFTGIANAIKAGDISLAVQVLWAGIKVEWLKGVQYVSGLWETIKSKAVEAFEGLKTDIAGTLIEIWAGMQDGAVKALFAISDAFSSIWPNLKIGFAKVTDFMTDAWSDFVSSMPKFLISIFGWFFDRFNELKGLITGTFLDTKKYGEQLSKGSEAFRQATDPEELAKQKAARHAKTQGLIEKRDAAEDESAKGKKETLDQIEQGRAGAQQALFDAAAQAREEREKATKDKLIAANKELADAEKELARLTTNARVLALGGGKKKSLVDEAFPDEIKDEPNEGLTPEGLDEGIEKAKEKVDIAGSFSASAAAGLGAGKSVAEEQLGEQKKTNNHLEKMNHKLENNKLVMQ